MQPRSKNQLATTTLTNVMQLRLASRPAASWTKRSYRASTNL